MKATNSPLQWYSYTDLVTMARDGDQEAISELYNRTYSAVYHTTRALIREEDTALDVLQDAYIKGFSNLDRLRAPEQFQAWMKMIATNTAKNVLKRKKPILFSEMENEDGEMEVEFVDDREAYIPDVAMDRRETSRLIKEILDTLPEDQRLVMGMFYYEELSVRQIAGMLDVSENTVKSRLNYGRKKVEAKVRDLERQGVKLYSLAPLPFLLLLLRTEASAAAVPSAAILETVTAECLGIPHAAAPAGKYAAKAAGKTAGKAAAKAAGKTAVKAAAKGGAKAVAAKVTAAVLALSLVGGGSAYVTTRVMKSARAEAPLAYPVQSAVEIAAPHAAEHNAYQTILNNYAESVGVDTEVYLQNPDRFYNGDHRMIQYFHMYKDLAFQYAYWDMNQDGVDEMLIGTISSYSQEPSVVDVYSFNGSTAVQLIDEPSLGDRSSLGIYEDGRMYFRGSNSAFSETTAWYAVDGYTLVDSAPTGAAPKSGLLWQYIPAYEPQVPVETAAPAEQNPVAAPVATPAQPAASSANPGFPLLSEQERSINDWVSAYETVLKDYQGAWYTSWEKRSANPENSAKLDECFFHAKSSDAVLFHSVEKLYYALHDLDGNGRPELMIGIGTSGTDVSIHDAFASDEGTPRSLFRNDYYSNILADGSIVKTDFMGIICGVDEMSNDGYTVHTKRGPDGGVDPLVGKNLWGDIDLSPRGGMLTGLDWHEITNEPIQHTSLTFDSIWFDVLRSCSITDYEANAARYNSEYSCLGSGIIDLLCHRDDGVHTIPVWEVLRDVDDDGKNEMIMALGLTPQHELKVFAIYDNTGDTVRPIVGDELTALLNKFPNGEIPVNWKSWNQVTITGKIY